MFYEVMHTCGGIAFMYAPDSSPNIRAERALYMDGTEPVPCGIMRCGSCGKSPRVADLRPHPAITEAYGPVNTDTDAQDTH